MKLNIEELAKQAGFGNYAYEAKSVFEAFTSLIVERCALECDSVQLPPDINMTGQMPSSAWEIGTMDAASAIRNLLEDK